MFAVPLPQSIPASLGTNTQNTTFSDPLFQPTINLNIHVIRKYVNNIRLIDFKYKRATDRYENMEHFMEASFKTQGEILFAKSIIIPKLLQLDDKKWQSFKNLLLTLTSFEYNENTKKYNIFHHESIIHRILTSYLKLLPYYIGKTIKYANSSKLIIEVHDEDIRDVVKSDKRIVKLFKKSLHSAVMNNVL